MRKVHLQQNSHFQLIVKNVSFTHLLNMSVAAAVRHISFSSVSGQDTMMDYYGISARIC